MSAFHYIPNGPGYVPDGCWIPPTQLLATPASTVLPTPGTTPIISQASLGAQPEPITSQAQTPGGTPAWMPGMVNATFTPATGGYSIPINPQTTQPFSRTPSVAPSIAPQIIPNPRTPESINYPSGSPTSPLIPLPLLESDDDEPAHVRQPTRKRSHHKPIRRVACCGACYSGPCSCSYDTLGSNMVIVCHCEVSKPKPKVEPKPKPEPEPKTEPASPSSTSSSWQDWYPPDIFYYGHAPTVLSRPPPMKEREKERFRFFSHRPKPLNINQWAEKAARHSLMNQVQAQRLHPDGVELHPMLNKATTSLFFNVLEPKEYISMADGMPLAAIEAHPATCPPLTKMEIVSFFHSTPIVVGSPHGVSVGHVIDAILAHVRRIVTNEEAEGWSPQKRGVVYSWYWYNRNRVYGMNRRLIVGDTFEGYTSFEGLMTPQQARNEDNRSTLLPPSAFVLSLGVNGYIPGLRPLAEFPY